MIVAVRTLSVENGRQVSAPSEKGDESMSLSERERRELERIEQSLYADDPELGAAVNAVDIGVVAMKRLRIGIAIVGLGLVLLVAGVVLPNVPVGVVGFLGMFAGGALAVLALPVVASSKNMSGPPTKEPYPNR